MEGSWILFILVNVVLALGVSIVGNFATPWVKSLVDKSIFSSRKIRIMSRLKEYNRMKSYTENTSLFVARLVEKLFYGLVILGSMLITLAFILFIRMPMIFSNRILGEVVVLVLFTFYMSALYYATYETSNFIRDVRDFERYKEKVKKKLLKLGAKPEEIHKALQEAIEETA